MDQKVTQPVTDYLSDNFPFPYDIHVLDYRMDPRARNFTLVLHGEETPK